MAFDEDIIRPWGLFLQDIAKEVKNEEFRVIKLILGDKLTARDRDSISEPVDLLELLEDKGLISEDDTALLQELFRKAEYPELIPRLNEYEANRKKFLEKVSMLAGRRDPLFVGRDSYIRIILDFFKEERHPGVRCVCLWGMAGTGKTKLGAETCTIYAEMWDNPKPRLVLVDLNKRNSIDDVGMAFLSSVGKPVEANKFKLHLVYDWIRSCREEYIFLFDNADDLLKPTSLAKDHFQNMLKQTLEWQQNSNIKIIITSRYAVKFPHLDNHQNFKEIEVQSLEMEEAVQLLFKSVQQGPCGNLPVKGQQLITKQQAKRLAEYCGNNPQALRAVASQLRSGKDPEAVLQLLANPMKMELVLNDQSLWGLGQDTTQESGRESNQVLKCLGVMLEDMNPNLKLHLIRLAIFPGLFSQTWGLKILSDVDQEGTRRQSQSKTLEFELDDVADTSLLLRESLDIFQSGGRRDARAREKFYSMHPLVRCLCLMKVEADEKMKKAFQSGLLCFIDECFQQLREFTVYDNEDACGSLQRLEKEKVNITQYLELEMHRTFSGKPHPLIKYLPEYQHVLLRSNMARESDILAFMEQFMFAKGRSKFFRQRAEAAKRVGDMPGWVNHQGWYADQELQLSKYHEAETAIANPLSYCQTQLAMTPDLREGYSQCLYVKGNLLVHKPQATSHIQNKRREEGIKILKECIQVRDHHLGNSLVRARSINALGSAYFNGMKYEEALEQHKLALEVLKTTQNHVETHPDFTYFLMNIGTCYHGLGYSYSRSISQKEKGRRYFEQAIRTFKDGQETLSGLGQDETSIMGSMLKNLAMTYCEMKDYKTALYYADRATGIRVKTLGDDHPDVARAHYFVGSLYMSLGEQEKKAGKNIFEIEEYKKARECFDKALIIEFKVGFERRSQDYSDLKEEIKKLFNILNKKREWQRYSVKFQEHEKGNFVPVTELEASSSSAGSEASTSSAGTKSGRHDRKRAGDMRKTTTTTATTTAAAATTAATTFPSMYASPQAASATFPPIRASLQSSAIFPPMHAGAQAAAKVSWLESRLLHLDTTDDGNQVHWDFLTDCPQELTLQDNEAVISCGIRFSPSRAKLSKHIKVTLDHDAHFSNPRRAEIVFYTSKKDSKSFERIPASTTSYPRCDVRVKDLDLYVDHFSDWWIVAVFTRYFVGKRVNCTPYVPPVRKEVSHSVFLCIYDDLSDVNHKIKEEMTDLEYTKLHPAQPMFIEWKHGDINIKLFEGLKGNEKEIASQKLGERDISRVDRQQFSFEVKPLEPGERQKFLKFTLNQNKCLSDPTSIKFSLPYDDMGTIRTTATTTAAATFSSTHVGLQAAAATFSPMHASSPAAEVSTLSQDNLESDRKLEKLSKHMPPRTYTMLCTYLGIGYDQANAILARFNMDYQRATRDCLAQWKTLTGGNMDELETILHDAEVGDLVKYIK